VEGAEDAEEATNRKFGAKRTVKKPASNSKMSHWNQRKV